MEEERTYCSTAIQLPPLGGRRLDRLNTVKNGPETAQSRLASMQTSGPTKTPQTEEIWRAFAEHSGETDADYVVVGGGGRTAYCAQN